ncbi:FMN-dependent oxidoreductase (nitrilotriacetate monooxygenase family) [Acinetobacter baylyi]|uniref:FMN-dependent oxidoreductase (Nitrilotriacetate monooxygenase family) n=1 Tax=Acinetobacter baylyi TaxID=202950 RepID=A0ABU0UUT0_ACIBI|nr:NtaA/DmoA family FMN-dependent monooxygenase [Acinetobacter baylyi]MDQ1208315.1 FMN-dependent oxidoreductase (nitrilotriacetate monooxygenase family) [Acinetobacter baylyi]MDR6108095.1 FMN-dependent oxidoreductase (nitrilotriacetate monooxygenase family) [Acinetobacter baylyi]MDR6185187.1 FMN-dependent oxidoreductase (nitrilotriacetate monooxygenase family) [Acinetobacter baylyi]
MKKRLIFNCFSMNTLSHIWHGLWRHPESKSIGFNDLETWIELAQLAEKGCFDAIFFADIIGADPGYQNSVDIYLKEGIHLPCNDSTALCAALIGSTQHIGLVLTSSILSEHPFSFARRISTLDHLSKGRIGWNIVTSVTHNAAQNFGFESIVAHDERYRWAEEYMEVVYKLWEGSWDQGAVVADKESGIYSKPELVHRIYHESKRYKVAGPHMCTPSPQRVPVLYQAGSSKSGRIFASRHAEGTFVLFPTIEGARKGIADARASAVAAGRNPDDLKFIQGFSFVVGSTEEEAWKKSREIDEWVSSDGLAAHIGRDMGIDFGKLDLDEQIVNLNIDGLQGYARMFEESNNGQKARIRDLVNALSYSSRIVGTPESIADQLEAWQEAGIDGVNMICQLFPDSYKDFIEYVIPVLQERGLAQSSYRAGTLREKMFPDGNALLPENHTASQYRGAFK